MTAKDEEFLTLFESDALSGTDREILTLRLGLKEGSKPMTLEAIGKYFALAHDRPMSRERVRQLQNVALSKLRRAWAKDDGELPLGRRFGMHRNTVQAVRTLRTWKHV